MKTGIVYTIILSLSLTLIFSPHSLLAFAGITQKTTIEKITLEGSYTIPADSNYARMDYEVDENGRIITKQTLYENQHTIKLSGADYVLSFYNVDEAGKGVLPQWREEYGLATLAVTYKTKDAGKVWTKVPNPFDMDGSEPYSFALKDAAAVPEIAPVVYRFRFTGGPDGEFVEIPPYKSKANIPVKGYVANGKEVYFFFPAKYTNEEHFLVQESFMNFPWQIEGDPFKNFAADNPCLRLAEENTVKRFAAGELFGATVLARDSGARFSDLVGQVEVYPESDSEDSRIAEMDDVLKVGEVVHTYEESCAVISFADMSVFVLGPESRVVFDTPPERKSKLRLIGGKIWANIKRMVKDGSMDITMNQAVAGIKGTTFILEDDGATSRVKVVEGTVEVTAKADGTKALVSTGETVRADASGLSEKERFDAQAENENWRLVAAGPDDKTHDEQTNGLAKSGDVLKNIILIVTAVVVVGWWYKKRKDKKRAEL